MADKKHSAVYLETSFGTPMVWVVWALRPGVAHLAAICTTEMKADRYCTDMVAKGGLAYDGCKMFKERVPMDHAFGWRDSIAAMVTKATQDHPAGGVRS